MTAAPTIARAVGLDAVNAFYRQVGYGGAAVPGDDVHVATDDGLVVAAVRLCREETVLVLRGMYVAADRRGRGIGGRMLRHLDSIIGARECWCLPFGHLVRFYGGIGFRVRPAESAPAFLRDRLRRYVEAGRDVTIMMRSPE